MPGLYLAAILISAAGVAALDVRFRLAIRPAPLRTIVSVLIGTAFFLAWDSAGIAAGVFVKGDSPALLGIDIAPELPLEEPVFLAFLCYLAVVVWAAADRVLARRRAASVDRAVGEGERMP